MNEDEKFVEISRNSIKKLKQAAKETNDKNLPTLIKSLQSSNNNFIKFIYLGNCSKTQ